MTEKLAASQVPGCSIAVLRDGETLFADGFGFANLEHEIPASAETVYEIASITKLFTAISVMQLVQSGKVNLLDRVCDHLPDLPAAWSAITLRHILAHQSGIKSYTAVDAYWETTRLDISRQAILGLVRELPLQFKPGARHAYDNTGYYLLGMLIEKVSGQRYADYLQQHVFTPLQMSRTRVNDPSAIVPQRAAGYSLRGQSICNKAYYSPSGTFSAGILLSTVVDLAKFAHSLYSDVLLNKRLRQLMWQGVISAEANERENNFTLGLGWFLVDRKDGRSFAGHNGSIVGFASAFAHFLDDRTTVIVLANGDQLSTPHVLGFEVVELLLIEDQKNQP